MSIMSQIKNNQTVIKSHQQISSASFALLALASLLVLGQVGANLAAPSQNSAETTIERPVHRTTSFVPRLGKREQVLDRLSAERILCANYGVDCGRLIDEQIAERAAILVKLHQNQQPQQQQQQRQQPQIWTLALDEGQLVSDGLGQTQPEFEAESSRLVELIGQQAIKRNIRASAGSNRDENQIMARGMNSAEVLVSNRDGVSHRVAFTPRIGRK